MPHRLHLFLYRHVNKAVLFVGFAATVWQWERLGEKAVMLIFMPALLVYLLLPAAVALGLRARCPQCGGPARLHDGPRQDRERERIYRCERCRRETRTGVLYEREPI